MPKPDAENSSDTPRAATTMPVIDRRQIPALATESRWRAADGQAIRRIDWPQPDSAVRGSILFLPGRGDFYEKYIESLEEWHRAGWCVTASDWRGQAGSGRLGDDEITGHIDDFSTWIADLHVLWAQWVASTPGPHILIAHSMGGHLVMRGLIERAVAPDAVVLSAPMLRVAAPPLPIATLHSVARVMARIGNPKRPAWKWSEKPGEAPSHRANLLTHDAERYADELWWREHRPELVMGPGSWGWVERAYASIRETEAPGVMEAVDTPVLIISTINDRLVQHSASEAAAKRLPHGEIVTFGEEAHHEILREVPAVRGRVMTEIAEFLDRVAPAQA